MVFTGVEGKKERVERAPRKGGRREGIDVLYQIEQIDTYLDMKWNEVRCLGSR